MQVLAVPLKTVLAGSAGSSCSHNQMLKALPTDHRHRSTHETQPYRILYANATSINNKLVEFRALFFTSANPDVDLTTETWLNISVVDSMVAPVGYKIFRIDDRQGRERGGGATVGLATIEDQYSYNF